MKYNPDPHQLEMLDHMVSNPRFALFAGMSTSKTVVALQYLYHMHYVEVAFLKTLIIAPPKVASGQWRAEIAKWDFCKDMRVCILDDKDPAKRVAKLADWDAEVYVISSKLVAWLVNLYRWKRLTKSGKEYPGWEGAIPFDNVLIDELTIFKSQKGEGWKALEWAIRPVLFRGGMTGTPAPNGDIDLWAQFKLLDDGKRLEATFSEYVAKYFTERRNGMIVYEYKPKPGAQNIIAHKIRDITLTIETRDVIKELPRFIVRDHVIELLPFDRDNYEQLEREYVLEFLPAPGSEYDEAPAVTVKTAADLTNKLLQISSGAVYEDRVSKDEAHIWHELNTLKVEAARDIFNQYDENFIIVYQFRHELERFKKAFPDIRELRKGKGLIEDIDAWNRGEISKLIIHPAGAGHGLNLQFGGRHLLWTTPTFNLEHWLQTNARLVRRGVTWDVMAHRLIAANTRDIKVCQRTQFKGTNQQFLMNEIKQLRLKYYGKVR